MNTTGKPAVRLTPLVRFMMEFSQHASLLPNIYDEKFGERLADRTDRYRLGSIAQLKLLTNLDALLLFLTVLKGADISLFGTSFSSLAYITEAVFLVATVTTVFCVLGFVSSQGHVAMVGEWCKLKDPIDPEYLQAAYSNQELFLRIFRADLNIQQHIRGDFFRPGVGFRRTASAIIIGLKGLFLVLFLIHLGIVAEAGLDIWREQRLGHPGTGLFLFGCSLAHIYAICVAAVLNTSFVFTHGFPSNPSAATGPAGSVSV